MQDLIIRTTPLPASSPPPQKFLATPNGIFVNFIAPVKSIHVCVRPLLNEIGSTTPPLNKFSGIFFFQLSSEFKAFTLQVAEGGNISSSM